MSIEVELVECFFTRLKQFRPISLQATTNWTSDSNPSCPLPPRQFAWLDCHPPKAAIEFAVEEPDDYAGS
jgi:hypothetical protein